MSPTEREAYLLKKKEDAKVKTREMIKKRWAESRKVKYFSSLYYKVDSTLEIMDFVCTALIYVRLIALVTIMTPQI